MCGLFFFVGGILIGGSHFPKVYDTYFQVRFHQAHQAVRTTRTSRSDHHGNKQTPPEDCDISPLANPWKSRDDTLPSRFLKDHTLYTSWMVDVGVRNHS